FVAIASDGTKHVSSQTVRMNPHQGGLLAFESAANQRNMLIVIDVAGVSDHAEIAEARGKNRFGHAAHVTFVLHAITNQFRDRKHFQIVLAAKFDELRHAGHGAVFIHDFADDTGIVESSNTRNV